MILITQKTIMRKFFFLVLQLLFCLSISTYAQTKPNRIEQSISMRVVTPLASKSNLIPVKKISGEIKDGRSYANKIIIGKGSTGDDTLAKSPHKLTGKVPGTPPSFVFDTFERDRQGPIDPSLAVGPKHMVGVYNTAWRVFDKSGNALTDAMSPEELFSPNSCCDLTISYDNAADRWVMSILFSGDGHVEVAVSQGPDPINDAWSVYSFQNIQDYQKLSVWSDGYYMTANANNGPSLGTSDSIFILDREAMLAGEDTATLISFPLPGISTTNFYSPQAFNVSSSNLPAPGNTPIVYLQDDAWRGVTEDHLKIWIANVNFSNPDSSTISEPTELVTTDFISVFDGGSFDNLTQPNDGIDIDAIQSAIMNQAQFRKFPTHNSAVFNFVVDTEGGTEEVAGIRWFELRQSGDGQPWTIFQEGTYTSPDGKHAWNGSMIMDGDGNIALGYTGMGGTTNTVLSSYYAGRFANDPAGTMTIDETLIATGGGNVTGSPRYGDYSKIDIDPLTDTRFWFVNDYVNAGGKRAAVAGVFQLKSDLTSDVAPVAVNIPPLGLYSATETITTTIYNLGTTDVSNFEVSYSINGDTPVTETFTGTIMPNQSADFSFAQTVDLSTENQNFEIKISTDLTSDERAENDTYSISTQSLFPNEIGIEKIISPESGQNLGNEEVTLRIYNFGGVEQSNFDVSYTLDGGVPITETVAGPLPSRESLDYTFTQAANLSGEQRYTIEGSTLLTNDSVASNNTFSKEVDNLSCNNLTNDTPVTISAPNTSTTITSEIESTLDEPISQLLVQFTIEHAFTSDLIIKLIAPDNTEVSLSSSRGEDTDNFTNTTFLDIASVPISDGRGPFTGSFRPETPLSDLAGKSTLGTWTLSVEDSFGLDGGQLVGWSLSFCSLRTLSVEENLDPDNDLKIIYRDNNQFDIKFESDTVHDQLEMDIFNLSGQRLLHHKLDKENEIGYYYNLDMSHASSGIYLVRIKDKENRSKFKRLVVN
ncbi:T9SS type A sorting domain-containing protein [Aquimarina sp. RZ0]|nr:T9SS type A sorting domain-containing protein [Aquimarina sp. RZ0]